MIRNTKSQKLIFSDGTSQEDRYQVALHPEYVEVESRSIEDLVTEAQRLAKEVQFFDEENNPVSNWEALFIDNAQEYHSKTETGKEILRKRWARQLAAFVENPESFQSDPNRLARLSRPHVVLFMTFLKLLNHVKSQVNGLTKKHLDFYFLERLGFTPKEAVPDVVNVLLELASDVGQLEVKKGTVLYAGDDKDGNELHYKTDRDTVISEAQIAQLKTVFVEKSTLSIKDAHLNNLDEPDRGFGKMLEMALGTPNPGDALPAFPNGVEDLLDLHVQLEQEDAGAMDYVANQLFFAPKDNFKDFRFIVQAHIQDLNLSSMVLPETWEEVYRLLDQAYKNGLKKRGQLALKEIREGDGGTTEMLRHVYGSPLPGDELPLYQGEVASVPKIFADLSALEGSSESGENADLKARKQNAVEYLLEELLLGEQDFIKLTSAIQGPATTAEEWDEVYKILELANRKVRSISLPSPIREELFNVYAEPDASSATFSLYGEEEESVRFKTLGGGHAGNDQLPKPANIGFAISSPILMLEEGKRKITTTVAFAPGSVDLEVLQQLFNPEENEEYPFQIFISSAEKWTRVNNASFFFDDYVVAAPEEVYQGVFNGQEMSRTGGTRFSSADLGKYLVEADGTVHEITKMNSGDEVAVKTVGKVEAPGEIQKFGHAGIYLNALRVAIELEKEDLPVVPLAEDASYELLYPEFPALVFSLNHFLKELRGQQSYRSNYQQLMKLKMDKVHLKVDVQEMQSLILQNDLSTINGKKPFEPFGNDPYVGGSFYLTNPELCRKRLDSLELDLQWMKMPSDFREHYKNYWLIGADDPDLSPSSFEIQGKEDFEAKIFLYDNRAELGLASVNLFPENGKISIPGIPGKIQSSAPHFNYQRRTAYHTEEDVLDCDRYFKCELEPKDFQHSVFNGLFRKQALSDKAPIAKMTINPPYTPKLKSIRAGYSSHTEILLGETNAEDQDRVYHLQPFGYNRVQAQANPYLLPQYEDEGTLYLGIDKLATPQTLSVLFQMSEGSADPDVEKPEVKWSCLEGNIWNDLKPSAILSDSTNGLLNTGIVQIEIPGSASNENTLLPGELHWLKVACDSNTSAISDTIQISSQAVSATFSSEKVAASHFVDLLAPESITETLEFNPEIRTITQPYTSSKGKPAEKDLGFYNRISERLRHKNRAVNMWDYERMVLDRFPEVFKVKCLPATTEQNDRGLGTVNVLVVPDIKGKLPFNPFEPKVPADTLFQVQQFLNAHAPAYADVTVRNPTYSQIKVRCVVKFKEGYNEGFYKPKLIEELKRFLAPWAYDEGGKITIGGSIYASVIINFIAERPYIEYVANMKLFQSEDGKQFTDVRARNQGQNKVVAVRPDTVLVSAQSHEIDIVDENGYDEDNFDGINYMKVELDFQVGENLLP